MKKTVLVASLFLSACVSRFPEFEPTAGNLDLVRTAKVSMSWGKDGKEVYTSWVKNGDNSLNFQYLTGPRVSFVEGVFNQTPNIGAPIVRTTKIEPGTYTLTQIQNCLGNGCTIVKGDFLSFIIKEGQSLSFPAATVQGFYNNDLPISFSGNATDAYTIKSGVKVQRNTLEFGISN